MQARSKTRAIARRHLSTNGFKICGSPLTLFRLWRAPRRATLWPSSCVTSGAMLGLWAVVAAVALAVYTYVGYPALLLLAARRRAACPPATLHDWPLITILLPARNEEAVIAATLENLLRADYPADRRQIVVLSDASTDRTDTIVSSFVNRGVELLRMPRRNGKTALENVAIPFVRGEIVVNTDASVHVDPNA